MSVITVENLRYRYPHAKELALDGLDFSVEKGEFIGIIGENGAGKSTIAINGTMIPATRAIRCIPPKIVISVKKVRMMAGPNWPVPYIS